MDAVYIINNIHIVLIVPLRIIRSLTLQAPWLPRRRPVNQFECFGIIAANVLYQLQIGAQAVNRRKI